MKCNTLDFFQSARIRVQKSIERQAEISSVRKIVERLELVPNQSRFIEGLLLFSMSSNNVS